jgi:hypothetical protein
MAAYSFLAKHLTLTIENVQGPDGTIDEWFRQVENYEKLLVCGPDNPYPSDAVAPNTPLP